MSNKLNLALAKELGWTKINAGEMTGFPPSWHRREPITDWCHNLDQVACAEKTLLTSYQKQHDYVINMRSGQLLVSADSPADFIDAVLAPPAKRVKALLKTLKESA